LETICSYKELFTNKQFLLGAAFLFIYNFAPGFGTPLMFIQRDVFHWSGTFMGLISAISSGLGIIGAILYFKYSKKINVKKCLFWSVFLVGFTNLCYLYFTPLTAILYTCIFSILGMFIFLNMMSFMAKSTLSGKEATSFALLCSINNLAGTFSTLTGAWLFPLIGLKCIIIIASLSAFLSLPILKRLEIK
jgi:predicted MFS family arabinose efflux permease